MPPRVYRGKSAFEWRPAGGGAIRLCLLDAPRSTVWARYEQEKTKYNATSGSFAELSTEYKSSTRFHELAMRTQRDYERYSTKVTKVFGKMHSNHIKPEHIRKYMDIRGKQSKTQANREFAYMSTVFGWGFERGKVPTNPCKGVRKFTEKARERYITDIEYQAVYDAAPIQVKIAMEISYLCAARKADVLKLTRKQLLEDGIFIKQGKTGKEQIKRWNPRLRAAVAMSKQIKKSKSVNIESFYVVHKRDACKYTDSGFNSLWSRAKIKAAKALGMDKLDFTFHDIKAKSISDYEGDKQRFSGHKTAAQVATYDRKVDVVDSLEPKK